MRARALGGFAAIAVLGACAGACSNDFDTTRTPPVRGTVGEELFGVLCDRVGAQALHEDLTGDSFHPICHKDATGAYADKVDTTKLPASQEGAVDRDNNSVTVAVQDANRVHAVARVEALARRRGDLIAALDATFPDVTVPVKDLKNSDETQSCNAPGAGQSGERKLSDELADLLGRFQDLYNDGTIPQSTESLARVFNAIKASPDAQQSLARFEARQGYRPLQVGLGAARPIVAYPNLRDLSNTALALLSSDSDPYKKDANGNHVFVPGSANPQFQKLIDVAHNEMLYATPDPDLKLLNDHVVDASVSGRPLLSRTRTNLEFLQHIFYAQNDVFGGGNPHAIVRRDGRGYAQPRLIPTSATTFAVPSPFVDADQDGFADVDELGRFKTTTGQPPAPPFFAPGLPFSGTRDTCGRLIGGPGAPSGSGGGTGGGGAGDAGDASTATDAGAIDSGSATGGGAQSVTEKLCGANDDTLQYEYIDTSHVFAGSLLNDLKPLLNPDVSQQHETLMYALAGAQVLFGKRDGSDVSQRCYATDPKNPATCLDTASILKYNAYHPETSPLVDLIYALGQVMADPTTDDTLAFVKLLFQQHLGDVARLAGDGLKMKANANADTKGKIPANSVFWDDMLDVTVSIEQEPGLLEDVLRALGKTGSEQLGTIFANYMSFNDRITYDRTNLNGKAYNATTKSVTDMTTPVDRTQPDKGYNRSAMQRFLQAIHDTNGVTACNKDGAVVHANIGININLPLTGTYKECEVFKIENLATFYLDSIVGKASIYFRPDILRNGILTLGAATVGVIETSSGIGLNANDTMGFWDATDSKTFRPRPQWLNRLVFFDQTNDNTAPTHDFLRDLQGTQIGTSICPERVINDPTPTAPDASADGKVHGLRSCHDGDWLIQRDADTMFVWEQFGFYPAMTPLLTAFVNHKKEDLFISLMEVLYKHWGSANADANECAAMTDQAGTITKPFCVGDGIVSYEPLLAQQFNGDFIPGLHDLEATLEASSIPHCTAIDATSHKCTTSSAMDGITVLANATRALLDPVKAKNAALVDRKGNAATVKNDGTAVPQTTPIYLLLNALNAMDASFDAYPEKDRLTQWRTARSQLVDQFLAVNGTDKSSTFANVSIPQIVPTIIDATRAQLFAYCPTTFQAPFDKCVWARETMAKEMSDVMSGPTFAASLDVIDAIRKDDNARKQMGLLIQYLLDAASKNDALPAVLASANDMIQLLKDDTNLVPLYHVLAQSLAKSQPDAQGNITQRSVVDAQLTLLGRISGRATDGTGKEICAKELDPNQVLTGALGRLVTPMVGANGQDALTPLQVIMDVIGDVNREAPDATDKFQPQDYASIADNVSDFMLNKERGLEQFYEIVRQGTEK